MKYDNVKRNDRELEDPALSALLAETFAGDPALVEAPGRTERIMRRLLASGIRPVHRRTSWAPLGWAFSAVSTALAVVVLAVLTMRMPVSPVQTVPLPEMASAPQQTVHQTAAPHPIPSASATVIGEPVIPARDTVARIPMREQPAVMQNNVPASPATAPAETPEETAAALYAMGTTASDTGNYEVAYEAHKASYEMNQTPEALLASGRALQRIAQQMLGSDG